METAGVREPGTRRAAGNLGHRVDFTTFGLVLALIFAVFGPGIVVPFGSYDDYAWLNRIQSAGEPLWARVSTWTAGGMTSGRILWGLLMSVFYRPGSIADLSLYRIVPMLSLALLAYCIARRIRTLGESSAVGIAVAVVFCTMPPFNAWLWFSILMLNPAAAVLGFVAGAKVASIPRHERAAAKLRVAAFSAACFVAASNSYQPSASFFWVGVALVLLVDACSVRDLANRALVSLACGLGSLCLAFASLKIGQAVIGRQLPRTALTADVVAKVRWFVSEPLTSALNYQNLVPSPTVALVVAACLCTGLLVDRRAPVRLRLLRLALVCVLVVLSYLPNLVVAESWGSYRSQAPLTGMLVVVGFAALRGFASRLRNTSREVAMSVAAVACAVLCVGWSTVRFSRDLVQPAWMEQRLMAFHLKAFDAARHKRILIRRPLPSDAMTDVVRFDEFGFPTTSPEWGAKSLARVLLREMRPSSSLPDIDSVGGEAELPAPTPDTLVIDMRVLQAMKF